MNALLAALAPPGDPAYEAGRIAGMTVLPLLGILLVIWSLRRLRHPDANAKCHLAFAIFLGSWVIGMVLAIVAKDAGGRVLTGLIVLAGALASVTLAILGLVELARSPHGGRGGGPAVITLLLAALGVVIAVAGRPSAGAAAPAGPPVTHAFPDLGFKLESRHPWVRMDAKKLNPAASLAVMRSNPQIFFMVIVESVEPDSGAETGMLAEVAKGNLLSRSPGSRVLEEGPESRYGRGGVRMLAEAANSGIPFTMRYWIHVGPKHAYQLIGWGESSRREEVLKEVESVLSGFQFLE